MTPESVLAFATPVALIVAAIMQRLDNLKAAKVRDAVQQTVVKTDEKLDSIHTGVVAVSAKVAEVQTQTNGHQTVQAQALKEANDRIVGLEKRLSEVHELLAQKDADKVRKS